MRIRHAALVLLGFFASACVPSVTGEDIENDIERELRSVEGPWSATSYGSNELTLNFQLQKGSGNAITGSGMMKEASAPAPVPITITGTFSRPNLSLTFHGMTFEGHAVQGTFQGSYTSLGLLEPLHLTGTGYTRDIQMLMSEDI